MKKNTILENIEVEKLVFWWKWFAKLNSQNPDLNWKTIFISGWVIPWSIVNIRVLKSRKDYIEAQCQEVIKKSPIEKQHQDNIYWDQAWSMWVNIPYNEQLKIKAWQISESLFHIKKLQPDFKINEIIWSPLVDKYRNKIEFSFWKFISQKHEKQDHFNVWFHKQWEFSKIEDFDGTILISDLANKIYKEIKDFAKNSWFPVYDQFTQEWFYRHIVIRQAFFTNQLMVILWINHEYLNNNSKINIDFLRKFLLELSKKYTEIKSIYLSLNSWKADIAIWDLELVCWEKFIEEKLLDLTFNISPKSFFQTNSYWAQALYSEVLSQVDSSNLKDFTVLDLYGWTWTIGMVFAPHSKKVISVELVTQASNDW